MTETKDQRGAGQGYDSNTHTAGVVKRPEDIIKNREKTHGSWLKQSDIVFRLKYDISIGPSHSKLDASQREALHMILTKVSRIVCGDPNEPDHWDDIAGYAKLGRDGHSNG